LLTVGCVFLAAVCHRAQKDSRKKLFDATMSFFKYRPHETPEIQAFPQIQQNGIMSMAVKSIRVLTNTLPYEPDSIYPSPPK
jgi:hypothetical protein